MTTASSSGSPEATPSVNGSPGQLRRVPGGGGPEGRRRRTRGRRTAGALLGIGRAARARRRPRPRSRRPGTPRPTNPRIPRRPPGESGTVPPLPVVQAAERGGEHLPLDRVVRLVEQGPQPEHPLGLRERLDPAGVALEQGELRARPRCSGRRPPAAARPWPTGSRCRPPARAAPCRTGRPAGRPCARRGSSRPASMWETAVRDTPSRSARSCLGPAPLGPQVGDAPAELGRQVLGHVPTQLADGRTRRERRTAP